MDSADSTTVRLSLVVPYNNRFCLFHDRTGCKKGCNLPNIELLTVHEDVETFFMIVDDWGIFQHVWGIFRCFKHFMKTRQFRGIETGVLKHNLPMITGIFQSPAVSRDFAMAMAHVEGPSSESAGAENRFSSLDPGP